MELTQAEKAGLNTALNEAVLVGFQLDTAMQRVGITFDVVTLPEDEPPPDDSRRLLTLGRVGRIAASHRLGNWNDEGAVIADITLEQLEDTVKSFGCQPIYGWDFFKCESDFPKWEDRLSVDERLSKGELTNCIFLFQEGHGDRHLDLWIWFGTLAIEGPQNHTVALAEFIADGQRWWKAFYARDAIIRDDQRRRGMFPLKPDA